MQARYTIADAGPSLWCRTLSETIPIRRELRITYSHSVTITLSAALPHGVDFSCVGKPASEHVSSHMQRTSHCLAEDLRQLVVEELRMAGVKGPLDIEARFIVKRTPENEQP